MSVTTDGRMNHLMSTLTQSVFALIQFGVRGRFNYQLSQLDWFGSRDFLNLTPRMQRDEKIRLVRCPDEWLRLINIKSFTIYGRREKAAPVSSRLPRMPTWKCRGYAQCRVNWRKRGYCRFFPGWCSEDYHRINFFHLLLSASIFINALISPTPPAMAAGYRREHLDALDRMSAGHVTHTVRDGQTRDRQPLIRHSFRDASDDALASEIKETDCVFLKCTWKEYFYYEGCLFSFAYRD